MTSEETFRALLQSAVQGWLSLTDEQLNALWRHFELMLRWNRKINLTRLTSIEEAVMRHYGESLFLASRIPEQTFSVADIGSGAGFPGYPVAILRTELAVTLFESDQRKAAFLREACGDSPNVGVQCIRGEAVTGSFCQVVSRAVRPSEVIGIARRVAKRVSLLVGKGESQQLSELDWLADIRLEKLPWGEGRYLFSAQVPRETPKPRVIA